MRFVVDSMLGKLAKWLRILGFDSIYARRMEDRELITLAFREKRILLTRDRRLSRNWIVKTVLVRSEFVEEQLCEVIKRLGLDMEKGLLSRCPLCNLPLIEIQKEEVKGRVPRFVYQTYNEFWRCDGCGRYYWEGTHWENIRKRVDGLKRRLGV
jgi:hypothetical protein